MYSQLNKIFKIETNYNNFTFNRSIAIQLRNGIGAYFFLLLPNMDLIVYDCMKINTAMPNYPSTAKKRILYLLDFHNKIYYVMLACHAEKFEVIF